MRTLTRYVLKEVLSHAALGITLFTFVIFMRDVGKLLELVVRNSAPLPSVAEIFFLTLPSALTLTLPMGVLVGILIGLSRMAADSEVTAMRASGIGSSAFVSMIAIFAVAAWLVALLNSMVIAPRSAAELISLQNSMKNAQVSFAVQPRVFYENFKDRVLYVQDAEAGIGAAVWKNIFLADISNPAAPRVTIAEQAVVIAEDQDRIRLHLKNGAQHETIPRSPQQYNITTFAESDIPVETPSAVTQAKRDPPAAELTTTELLRRSYDKDPVRARWYLIEFHRRMALPTSCLVLALVGIPLGLSSKKGGKSTGFVLTILLVFAYYIVSLSGVALSRQGKLPPAIGVWIANFVFGAAGIWLLRRVDRSSLEVGSISAVMDRVKALFARGRAGLEQLPERRAEARVLRQGMGSRFPLILDNYVLRKFFAYFLMVLASFIVLTTVFTFFELLGDIIKNRVPLVTVGEYLLNVTPSMIYLMTPLSVLVAVLVTFSLLQSSNELTAMKATGISVYRVVIPVLAVSLVLSASLFLFEQFYLPDANTRQEALRNSIKGKPAQTFLRPERKWIFGQNNTIYYYEHFDPDQNEFAGLSVFQFDPKTFQITTRIYATRARWSNDVEKWILEKGWSRTFAGEGVETYRRFDATTFDQVTEQPGYFKKEVKQYSEMNYTELARYIADLSQSGFDTVRLRVQLYKKVAYPLIVFVMAVLAVPFSLQAGRRGALTGIAVALGIAIVYWMSSGLFEALGNVNQLPAALAAWAPNLLFGLAGGYLMFKVQT
jgi:LPS export ABC transporter permease LptG/LPS export ABC transporter permease LptF